MWTEFFEPPLCALHGQFFYPERGQKQTFFDPVPPHLVHVVIECPLKYNQLDSRVLDKILLIFLNVVSYLPN